MAGRETLVGSSPRDDPTGGMARGGRRRTVRFADGGALEVAALLSDRGYEDAVVAAGLLHDVVEDTATSADEIDSLGLAVSRDLV
jgi:hypothetical protein